MSQNDYTIGNQSAPDFRSDLNDAIQALASLSSGSTAPSTTYANMLWYDTSNNILKMRTEADDAWISIGTLNQSTNEFEVSGLTTLSEATWETGTSTTESLVSPAKVKAAIEANAGGGLTLLGTLTTTSGATQTLSGLDLTGYKFLRFVVDEVSHNTSGVDKTALLLEGVNISANFAGFGDVSGVCICDLSNGVFAGEVNLGRSGNLGISTATTSLTFSWANSASFDNGQILVYGEA